VPGYTAPPDETLTLNADGVINFAGNYGQYNLTSTVAPTVDLGLTVLNQDVSFVSTVQNTGSSHTPTGFTSTFKYCWGVSCVPSILIGSELVEDPLMSSEFRYNVSEPINLTQTDSLSVEHCVDTNNVLPDESDETDNCTTRVFPVTTTASSLSVSNCIIADDENYCSANATWDITGALDPYIQNTTWGFNYANQAWGNEFVRLERSTAHGNQLNGYNEVIGRDGSLELVSRIATAACLSNSFFHNVLDVCKPKIDIEILQITFASLVIRNNNTSNIDFRLTNTNFEVQCSVIGGVAPGTVITHTGAIPTNTYTITTLPLYAAQTVRITCAAPSVPASTTSEDVNIYVVPNVVET
jgi:hypothetical protein